MINNLAEDVLDRLLAANVDDASVDLVLAALEGDHALDAAIDGSETPARPDPTAPRTTPTGAFLTRLVVRGFRGIGEEAILNLPPGPGLTVVAGRNGSGKSSFSEALECALTGTTGRWSRKVGHADLRTGWRNLHHPEPSEVALTLDQAGSGQATIRVAWAPGEDDLGVASRSYQVAGQKREQLALGWEAALESHRPFLSYDDLGQLVTSTPSQLHDSIARALGLDELNEAVERLRTRVAPLKAPLKRVNEDRKKLRSALVDVEDDRARAVHALLGKTEPDLDALSVLVAGGAQASVGPADICQRILAVTLPAEADVEAAAAELEGAQTALADLGERRSRVAELRDQLLAEALEYHAAAGETPCPVCEVGVLDAAWQTRTAAVLQQTDLLRHAHQEAESRLQRAELATRRLLSPAPAVLGQTDVGLPSQAATAEAWRRWAFSASPDPEHLRGQLPLLTAAVADWQSEARDHAESIAERWAPFALRLAALVTDYRKALALDQQGRRLDDAHGAATQCVATLREERLRPIVEQTLQIWSQLKQESNVSLETIALTSRNTRRGVDIRAVVDDASGANALSVMSQGELNSLALAMYLPRATSDESPFRFLVLDDPVQAMDPTKVEGLAAVLADLARTRQVIVFSHDDRLAHAARRLPKAPTILSVQRDRHSHVIVQNETRPAQRQLDDAYAIVREARMDDNVKRRVLPGVLRAAIEAAAWERLCAERLKAGDRLEDLEQQWAGAERTRARLEVVLGASMSTWLGRDQRRTRALHVCNAGTHQPMTSNPHEAYDDARAVVQAIENKQP